jgi:hypothetical protein
MSTSDHTARIVRWNKFKTQADTAGRAVIRATQFLVRPDLFLAYSIHEIKPLWDMWAEQNEIFHRMTLSETFTEPVFPKMPAVDAEECCFKMWGLLIQVQIDGTHGSTDILYETVREIAKNDKCKSHPATCSCHVPDHPWVYPEDIAALAPIDPPHCLGCKCGGMERTGWCRKQDIVAAVHQETKPQEAKPQETKPTNYTHRVDECACGICYKARVDSGTQDAYERKVHDRSNIALCVARPQPLTQAQPTKYTHDVDKCACGICHKTRVDAGTQDAYEKKIQERSNAALSRTRTYESVQLSLSQACLNADLAIAKATTMSGGGPDKPDFAKNLFAAMGTPHDSKCPHGLPFYACMPCSH